MQKKILSLLLVSSLVACESSDKKNLVGERIDVIALAQDLKSSSLSVSLPQEEHANMWPQSLMNARHQSGHIFLASDIKKVWESSIEGSSQDPLLLNPPIIVDNVVYAFDGQAQLHAIDLKSGNLFWKKDLSAGTFDDVMGGGVSYENNILVVGSPRAEVIALSSKDGKELWRQKMPGAVRVNPTIADGRVFALTNTHELFVFDLNDGKLLWSHKTQFDQAGFLGGASVAVHENVAIVPYASGEVFALDVKSGRVLWSDSFTTYQKASALLSLAHIVAHPVIVGDVVYLLSHSGYLTAVQLHTGQTLWEREVSGTSAPCILGDFLFVLAHPYQMLCLHRESGALVWRVNLNEPKNKTRWSGPVAAGGQLILTGSSGLLRFIDPLNGATLGTKSLTSGTDIEPIVANDTLLVLTRLGDLIAYR